MWNFIIDFMNGIKGKISLDIVFWAGVGVVGLVLAWGIIRAAIQRKVMPICRYKFGISKGIIWAYFIFALFAVTTYYETTINFGNFMVYMAYPIVVVLASYIIVWVCSYLVRCKLRCNEWQGHHTEAKERAPKEEYQDTVIITPDSVEINNVEVKGEDNLKIMATNKNGRKVEVTLPEIEPMYTGSHSPKLGLANDSYDADKKIERISNLSNEIERRRQKNEKITDGKKENRFLHDAEPVSNSGDPKVVARKIVEQVKVKPEKEEAPKTGFTYQRIVERKEVENKATTGSQSVTHSKSAQDVLDAIAKLRSSMNAPKND